MTKRPLLRRAGKWILRGFLALVLLETLHISALAFPMPAFAHKNVFDEFTVYSNEPLPDDFDQVAADVRARIEAMENARPGRPLRVFLCRDQRLYSVFTFLSRRGSNSLGLGLSAFGNIYVNETKVRSMGARGDGMIRHSRFEGNCAEVIAHEVAHFNIVKTLGYRAAGGVPTWKSEGFAEHQANLAATQADPSYDFAERIDLLRDDAFWGDAWIPRSQFEWHLLVEFLADIKGLVLEDLVDEAVTESDARAEMFAWHEAQH